jgi:hypothetical protein
MKTDAAAGNADAGHMLDGHVASDHSGSHEMFGPSRVLSSNPSQSVLLSRYMLRGKPFYELMRYLPRQFAAGLDTDLTDRTLRVDAPGLFAGWDVMLPPNYSSHGNAKDADWLTLTLNRPAQAVVVWRDPAAVPAWLSSWTRASDVVINGTRMRTFSKLLPAGSTALGGMHDPHATTTPWRHSYIVLLAEQNGVPSVAPAVPADRAVPRPNASCPAWVHDQYVATGPDGKLYPTWHPQIDPVYWCYFHHEHGSDPALFAPSTTTLFGYVAAKHNMTEPHVGFKNYVWEDGGGQRWLMTQHMGTSGAGRACARFHSLDLKVLRVADGKLLADLHLMGDYGRAEVNTTLEPLTPTACPDQHAHAVADDSKGLRLLGSAANGNTLYEPWRVDSAKTLIGFTADGLVINVLDAATNCADKNCNSLVTNAKPGTFRVFRYGAKFGLNSGTLSGAFYTEPYGRERRTGTEADAVRQYIAAGTTTLGAPLASGQYWRPLDPWQMPMTNDMSRPIYQPLNLEDALRLPN